jgi:S1-C subfamily serine protease
MRRSRNLAWVLAACAIMLVASALLLELGMLQSPATHHARMLLTVDSALGATLEPLDDDTARSLGGGVSPGEMVVTSVENGGPAASVGLAVGDIIERIGDEAPSRVDDAAAALTAPGTTVVINRRGKRAIVRLSIRPAAPQG